MTPVTKQSWAKSLLLGLGLPVTSDNVDAIVGWENAEGGHWSNTATYNPLNTTQVPASGSYGNTGTQGNIKAYSSWGQGLAATITTLKNGSYGGILDALKKGNDPNGVAAAIGSSPWGTSGSLVSQTIGASVTGNVGVGGGGTISSTVGTVASAVTGAVGAATSAVGSVVSSANPASWVSTLWNDIKGSAEYAGLFIALLIAGAYMLVKGAAPSAPGKLASGARKVGKAAVVA